jgi:hypothetical protein
VTYKLIFFILFLSVLGLHVEVSAEQSSSYLTNESQQDRNNGNLPNRGSLSDILKCAGANEIFWTTEMRTNPYSYNGQEAKRKAGWYAAVALDIFGVSTQAVIDAVRAASVHKPRSEVFEFARRCRNAPNNWRD